MRGRIHSRRASHSLRFPARAAAGRGRIVRHRQLASQLGKPARFDLLHEQLDLLARWEHGRALQTVDPRDARAVLELDAVLGRVAPLAQPVQVLLELTRSATSAAAPVSRREIAV